MKKNILHLISLLIVVNTYSQDNIQNEYKEWKSSQEEYLNFNIGKYFTPDIVRNQLYIYFDMNSDYSKSNSDNKLYVYNSTSANSIFTGNIASNFSRYTNTRKKISNFEINLSLNENFSSQDNSLTGTNSGLINDNNTINIISKNTLGLGWSNKRYFSKLFFLNYNLYGNISYNFTQDKKIIQKIESNQKQNEFIINFSPRLGFGYGRIENIEDAHQAVYIANSLSKRKILTRNLSNEELFELSQQISTIKNKRFLDSRLHLIDEISTVDSFFVKKDLLSNNGADYFTTLYDMWQYGALFSRKAGYEISFVVYPYYTYDYIKNIPELQSDAIHYSHRAWFEADLAFNYEKPLKLNWQHSVGAGAFAYFQQGKFGKTDFKSIFSNNSKMFSAFAQYSLGYYPNTRTNVQATVGQQIRKWINNIVNDEISTYIRNTVILNLSLNYYFSPYFKIAGSYGLNYDRYNVEEHSKNDYFSTSLNISLMYSFY